MLGVFTVVIESFLPEPHAGLLAGMLFGVKSSLSKELYEALITTGTLHIVALSGMNISILIAFANLLLLRFLRRPIANTVTVGSIIGFIWLVGPTPSVIRAAIMGCLSLLAINLGRQRWVFITWLISVCIMLVVQPSWIGDISFQLSVMATLGIILFGPSNQGYKVRTFKEIVYDDLRVTLAAQMFTIPIIFFAFGRISLVSPLSNVLIGWLIAPVMIGGFLMILAGLVMPALGQITAWIVWVPLQIIIQCIELTARIPFASIQW